MGGFGFSETLIDIGGKIVHHVVRAAPTQGGVISGENPTEFKTTDPLRLWVIQVVLVIVTTQLLSLVLRLLRQPRVISEVLSGIILGPSIMGRIPRFTSTIFPPESLSYLTLTANIGLVLFLFLVGLETDTRVISRNARFSVFVAAGGMILPFGLGTGVASLVYNKFVDSSEVSFGNFLLFVGVAFAITAFPVLCRILTELNLLETTVGIVVLSAGVGNDIIAWVLLALAVSLVNASSGLTALWVLLATTAFAIFILIPVRYAFVRLAKRTGALEEGQPSAFMMTVVILIVFASAFCTDILGVHPIFGGFLAGLVIPHESGFAISLTEKLEDLVSLLFLPLYFTLSGLKTDLGLLDNGITWAYTILILVVAFIGKFVGASTTSKWLGFSWREAGAIGILMSCKGLVELIVLNIGLQAGILSPRVFAMFVIEALVLTFITTPLTLLVYPPEHRTLHSAPKPRVDEESRRNIESSRGITTSGETEALSIKRRIAVMLYKMENLSPLMTMTQLLGASASPNSSRNSTMAGKSDPKSKEPITEGPQSAPVVGSSSSAATLVAGPTLDALRLMDLSERTSAVMYGSVTAELLHRDPMVAALRTFARLHNAPVTTAALSVIPYDEFPVKLCERAKEVAADLVLLPWNTSLHPVVEVVSPARAGEPSSYNPFEGVFGKAGSTQAHTSSEKSAAVLYAHFIRRVFSLSFADVALFIEHEDNGAEQEEELNEITKPLKTGYTIFLPYFGGPDDRLALNFVVQLCSNGNGAVQARIVRITKTEPELSPEASKGVSPDHNEAANMLSVQTATGFPDTVYGPENTQHRLESETADNLVWDRFANRGPEAPALNPEIERALTHITFTELSTPTPLASCIEQLSEMSSTELSLGTARGYMKNVMAVVGRGRRLAIEDHHLELKSLLSTGNASQNHVSSDARKTLGDVGAAFIVAGPSSIALLVMQAAHASTDV
ncbi:related to KHA1-Putative K+/H+ antiporter [Serendipita indica DSM 11827]|uniref:Related to KHA1-Putative K+/H+ antiporter n=1 Tax=Serendipita indica (strain DSM 11827) TaxID=1109443 RepID=G4TH90_SERID|nr:related to KHA1-Putative K+/H+ antiporter [Serendipita indica DSM 11827]